MNQKKIRVLVVDDSKYMRYVLARIINEDPGMEVAAEARDGLDALDKVRETRPDVVTMDIEMPRMDGLEALKHIMADNPTPTLMISKYTKSGADETIKALDAGAVDFVEKPDGRDSLTLNRIKLELISKIKIAAGIEAKNLAAFSTVIRKPARVFSSVKTQAGRMSRVIVIASSTGGPKALSSVIPLLPADIPAGILIVQHMPAEFTASLAARLDNISLLEVAEAKEGDLISPGKALVAPGGFHMRITDSGKIRLTKEDPVNNVRPAANLTLSDAAKVFGEKVVCVVLTGMGSDGTAGAADVKKRGGVTIVQDAATCTVNGMPGSVAKAGLADKIVPLGRIAAELAAML